MSQKAAGMEGQPSRTDEPSCMDGFGTDRPFWTNCSFWWDRPIGTDRPNRTDLPNRTKRLDGQERWASQSTRTGIIGQARPLLVIQDSYNACKDQSDSIDSSTFVFKLWFTPDPMLTSRKGNGFVKSNCCLLASWSSPGSCKGQFWKYFQRFF